MGSLLAMGSGWGKPISLLAFLARRQTLTWPYAVLLFKRLESRVEAFRQTVAGLIERYRLLFAEMDEGIIIASEEVEGFLRGIEPSDAESDDLLAQRWRRSPKESGL